MHFWVIYVLIRPDLFQLKFLSKFKSEIIILCCSEVICFGSINPKKGLYYVAVKSCLRHKSHCLRDAFVFCLTLIALCI
jgi:hypothetical protein